MENPVPSPLSTFSSGAPSRNPPSLCSLDLSLVCLAKPVPCMVPFCLCPASPYFSLRVQTKSGHLREVWFSPSGFLCANGSCCLLHVRPDVLPCMWDFHVQMCFHTPERRGFCPLWEKKYIPSMRCPSGNVLLHKEWVDSQCSNKEENT